MGLFNTIRMGASGASDYEIEKSLRFTRGSTNYLERTPSSDGNKRTWTFSAWIKRGQLTSLQTFFSAGTDNPDVIVKFTPSDQFEISRYGGGYTNQVTSTQLFRDSSAWYHIVGAVDTTQATASNRVKMYVNGTQITDFAISNYPSQNYEYPEINDTGFSNKIGKHGSNSQNFDGYMAEINFIDGQQLTPSSFAETDATTGQWNPKKYDGSYGTNGFYLNFSDSSGLTATTLGKDSSGNGHNFTPYNFSTHDSVPDSPTNNFCTGNPVGVTYANSHGTNQNPDYSEGNLEFETVGNPTHATGTIAVNDFLTTGCYFELLIDALDSGRTYFGIVDPQSSGNSASYGFANKAIINHQGDVYGNTAINGTRDYDALPSSTMSDGDIVGVAIKGTSAWIHINGTYINNSSGSTGNPSTGANAAITSITDIANIDYLPYAGYNADFTFNFGQDSSFAGAKTAQGNTDAGGIGDFYYPVPTGFKAICTKNMPDPTILLPNQYFDSLFWTGNNSSRNITGLEFDPDFVWAKNRTIAYSHEIYDTVRGNTKRIFSNNANTENSTGALSFGVTGGFALAAGGSLNDDDGTNDIVAWNWKGGGSASSNNDGSLTASVSANPTAGFSIGTFTAQSSGSATVGHGLGVAPNVVITKSRTSASNWYSYHQAIGQDGWILLDTADAATTGNSAVWNPAPTSSVFTYGSGLVNQGDVVFYAFSEVAGYSKMGTYIGNANADGTYVYTGFRPAFVLTKGTWGGNWNIYDNKRPGYNVTNDILYPNLNNVEYDGSSTDNQMDMVANGFKLRGSDADTNNSGQTFIYMAFAEFPFKYSRAR